MASVTFKAVVYSQYRRRDGTYPVRIRVTANRKSRYITTNISVVQSQLTRGLNLKDASVVAKVDDLIRRFRTTASRLNLFALEQMGIDDIVSFLMRETEEAFSLDFPTFAEERYGELGKGWMNYRSAVRSLSSFLGREHYDISVITSSVLTRWERWLKEKHGERARAVSLYPSSIAHLHSMARKEYNDEELDEIRIRNPFANYSVPEQGTGVHRHMAPSIVNLMLYYRKGLEGRERLGVDVFLISFALMGMNAPDLYACLPPTRGVLEYERQKTRERRADRALMRVRIEDEFRWLLEEYKDGSGRKAFRFCVRGLGYANYREFERAVNIGLHEFQSRLGLKTPLTLYVARHTFATVARSSLCGVDKSTVNECICHVDGMRTTDLYAEKDWRVIWEANRRVQNLFAWSEK